MPLIGSDLFQPVAKKDPSNAPQIVLRNVSIFADAAVFGADMSAYRPLFAGNAPYFPSIVSNHRTIKRGDIMETLTNWLASGGLHLGGIAAVVCGIALLYLVMARTQKRLDQTDDAQG